VGQSAGPTVAERPAHGILQRKCDCGTHSIGGAPCTRCAQQRKHVQRRAAIGPADDAYEREADRVADQIVNQGQASVPAAPAAPIAPIARFAAQGEPGRDSSPASVERVLASAGQPLASALRQDMEARFHHDFSGVRVHTSADAAQSAREIGATAYTSGRHIAFAGGHFAPGTREGRRLLAHELTHVVQQSGQRPSGAVPAVQRDSAGGGSTDFEDTAPGTDKTASGVIEGDVRRVETAPAGGGKPAEKIHQGSMRVRFDPAKCAVTIPATYKFVQADKAAQAWTCEEDPAPGTKAPPLAADAFARLKAGVLADLNSGMNGWFTVRLTGPGCPGGCSDKALPIQVEATENDASASHTITVVNRGGRADAATICAKSWNKNTALHEGGHQILGVGDEYPETDERLRAANPEWFRPERVRRDYSMMGPDKDSSYALFHQRHFNAVATFMEAAFPKCKASLEALARPVVPDFRLNVGVGMAKFGGVTGAYLSLGVGMGIPLDRLRRWELVLGPQLTLMESTGAQGINAFLLGARVGLQGSTGAASHGFNTGVFGEAGHGWFGGSASGKSLYGEAGVKAGYRMPRMDATNVRPVFGVEAALGSTLGGIGTSSALGSDPARLQWFRLGLSVGAEF